MQNEKQIEERMKGRKETDSNIHQARIKRCVVPSRPNALTSLQTCTTLEGKKSETQHRGQGGLIPQFIQSC